MQRRHHRLRLGQSALRGQGVRARGARERGSTAQIKVTADPKTSRAADRIVLPGVGAFADCRAGLDARRRHDRGARTTAVQRAAGRFSASASGMQLMAERGCEYEVTPGLGWIEGEVRADRAVATRPLKIPHMGWNTLDVARHASAVRRHSDRRGRTARLFRALLSSRRRPSADARRRAPTMAAPITAVVWPGTTWPARQFHPEKSQTPGLAADRELPEVEGDRADERAS